MKNIKIKDIKTLAQEIKSVFASSDLAEEVVVNASYSININNSIAQIQFITDLQSTITFEFSIFNQYSKEEIQTTKKVLDLVLNELANKVDTLEEMPTLLNNCIQQQIKNLSEFVVLVMMK